MEFRYSIVKMVLPILEKIPSQNIQKITLSEGGNVSNLQLAQSYASANVLSIESVNPDSNFYIANLGYGSFNHVLGSFNINQKVKKMEFWAILSI